jgi:putative transposase
VCGRKRHILVDTEGHLLAVVVHAADVGEREGARWVLRVTQRWWRRLQQLWADQGYTGDELAAWLRAEYGIELEIVGKPVDQAGFVVLPRRWVVERTLAWLGRSRRLSKEYEHWPEYTETVIYLASLHFLLKRLAPARRLERPYTRRAA